MTNIQFNKYGNPFVIDENGYVFELEYRKETNSQIKRMKALETQDNQKWRQPDFKKYIQEATIPLDDNQRGFDQ